MGAALFVPVIVPAVVSIVQSIIGLFHHTKTADPTKPGGTVPLTTDQADALKKAAFDAAKAAMVIASKNGAITAIPDDATIRTLIDVLYASPTALGPSATAASTTNLSLALVTALKALLEGAK